MKKLLSFIFACLMIGDFMCLQPACKTIPVGTQIGKPEVSWDGHKLCLKEKFGADLNQDSLLLLLGKGIIFGNDTNNIKINYMNGHFSAEGNGCFLINK